MLGFQADSTCFEAVLSVSVGWHPGTGAVADGEQRAKLEGGPRGELVFRETSRNQAKEYDKSMINLILASYYTKGISWQGMQAEQRITA